ncbi:hypothetical protein H0R92_13570 [Treponema sp. OMZ 840]|uniref:hypothetical protein n=1 Tax=Treponema sp. OMZ 840 TaxID=244313 RepID=UPI003D900DE1
MILFFSCATSKQTEKTPEWLTDIKSVYPENRFIALIGSGKNQQEAENDAAAYIAQFFSTEISRETFSEIKMSEENGGFSADKSIDSRVRLFSKAVFSGIVYEKPFYDKKKNVWFSAAVIDKQKAWIRLGPELSALEAEIVRLYDKALTEKDSFTKIMGLKKTEILCNRFNEKFIFAHALNPASAALYNHIQTIRTAVPFAIYEAAQSSPIHIQTENDQKDRIAMQFTKTLAAFGFPVTDDIKTARYVLTAHVRLEEKSGELIAIIPSVQAAIKNQEGIFYSYAKKGQKVLSYTLEGARHKAFRQLETDIEKSFLVFE